MDLSEEIRNVADGLCGFNMNRQSAAQRLAAVANEIDVVVASMRRVLGQRVEVSTPGHDDVRARKLYRARAEADTPEPTGGAEGGAAESTCWQETTDRTTCVAECPHPLPTCADVLCETCPYNNEKIT